MRKISFIVLIVLLSLPVTSCKKTPASNNNSNGSGSSTDPNGFKEKNATNPVLMTADCKLLTTNETFKFKGKETSAWLLPKYDDNIIGTLTKDDGDYDNGDYELTLHTYMGNLDKKGKTLLIMLSPMHGASITTGTYNGSDPDIYLSMGTNNNDNTFTSFNHYLGSTANYNGRLEITKFSEDYIEGIFHFTGYSSSGTKKMIIKNGKFHGKLIKD